MFLQNLKKRLSDFFRKIIDFFQNINFQDFSFKEFIETNFLNIFKVIILIGIFIISLIFVIFLIGFNKNKHIINKSENIVSKEREIQLIDRDFLLENEFLYPEIKFFDITVDYKEFMPLKKSKLPELNEVLTDYEFIFKDSIDDSLKFNFEKRRGK